MAPLLGATDAAVPCLRLLHLGFVTCPASPSNGAPPPPSSRLCQPDVVKPAREPRRRQTLAALPGAITPAPLDPAASGQHQPPSRTAEVHAGCATSSSCCRRRPEPEPFAGHVPPRQETDQQPHYHGTARRGHPPRCLRLRHLSPGPDPFPPMCRCLLALIVNFFPVNFLGKPCPHLDENQFYNTADVNL